MNLIRCEAQGHFYDADKYAQCPHCSTGYVSDSNVTVALPKTPQPVPEARGDVTVPLSESLKSMVNNMYGGGTAPMQGGGNDEKTIGISVVRSSGGVGGGKQVVTQPVVGWLVCVEGNNFGKDYRLKGGKNTVGRGNDMDVQLAGDNTVSHQSQAVLIYEPKTIRYLITTGESSELCYLNGEVVLTPVEIKHHDILTVGNTNLMFFPCCDSVFNWGASAEQEQ